MALALPDRAGGGFLIERGRRALLVFLKAPRAGEVKTRLASVLGDAVAAEIYRALTEAVMKATAPRDSSSFDRVLCFAPADGRAEVEAWFAGEVLVPQEGDDLGARMHHAFTRAFSRGAQSVLLIGTDCPSLDHEIIEAAFAALESEDVDVLLRAADDGGYTLIGLKRAHPGIFEGVTWSTDTVLQATKARAAALGLRVAVHGPDRDIDTVDDLREGLDRLKPFFGIDLARRVQRAVYPDGPLQR